MPQEIPDIRLKMNRNWLFLQCLDHGHFWSWENDVDYNEIVAKVKEHIKEKH